MRGILGRHTLGCRSNRAALEDYLEGRLAAPARAVVEQHLHRCPRCRQALTEAQAAAALFALAAPACASPGPSFVPRVMARLAAAWQQQRREEQWQPMIQAARRLCWTAVAVAFVLSMLLVRMATLRPTPASAGDRLQLRALVADNTTGVSPAQDEAILLVASNDRTR